MVISDITFRPRSRITDFLGTGYSTNGVAQTFLANLLPIYPHPSIVVLSQLHRLISDRNARAGDQPVAENQLAFQVVMFKKFSTHLPSGITVDALGQFFTEQFSFENNLVKKEFYDSTHLLLNHPLYYKLVITVPTFNFEVSGEPTHVIVAAVLYMYDNKEGSYVSLIGVTNMGDPEECSLSSKFFTSSDSASFLSNTPITFRGRGLATFLLATLQLLGHIRYQVDPETSLDGTMIKYECKEDDDDNRRHHLYLQSRLEFGSAYVMYVSMGFTTLAVENVTHRSVSYCDQCPVNRNKLSHLAVVPGYNTDDPFLRLLVLKNGS